MEIKEKLFSMGFIIKNKSMLHRISVESVADIANTLRYFPDDFKRVIGLYGVKIETKQESTIEKSRKSSARSKLNVMKSRALREHIAAQHAKLINGD